MRKKIEIPSNDNCKIAIIGLGYVGLPLAVEFGKKFNVIGFDINKQRILQLNSGCDATLEVDESELQSAINLTFSSNIADLQDCNVYIVTVPTPIDIYKRPDLTPLLAASVTVGNLLEPGNIVIYESTVYPGATEDDCVPVLEKTSDLTFNEDFFVGYSPERINPGDKEHRLTNIRKITSGSTEATARFVDSLYAQIISAGTYLASSIKVAEAAKIIENTQRDVNIALINEFSIIFNLLDIDTLQVLEAAETKWNFLPFRPGLVGGHCIGVDPYYLTHKAEAVGYYPQVVLSGRRINDGMGKYVAGQLVKLMLKKNVQIARCRVLVLGLTFKENCPDMRNTRVVDVISEIADFGISVDVHDPWADRSEAYNQHGITLLDEAEIGVYDAIIIAVPHKSYLNEGISKLRSYGVDNHVFIDLKGLFPNERVDFRL